MPRQAVTQARHLRSRSNRTIREVVSLWRRYAGPDFDDAFYRMGPALFRLLDNAQLETAREALEATPAIMESFDGYLQPAAYVVEAERFVGVNGDGMDTMDTMWGAVVRGKQLIEQGALISVALHGIEYMLVMRSRTMIADTQRAVASVSARSRNPYAGYVRCLTPPSCGRCVVLAGKPSGSVAFERHPNCDCTACYAGDPPKGCYADANSYLDSLSDEELAHTLGSRANARAWKDGADVSQLVNAYRHKGDVRTAQVYDRRIKYTTEGTTKRGWANWAMRNAGYAKEAKRGGRYTRLDRPRLMPETIYQIAGNDPDKAYRMLKNYGWIPR